MELITSASDESKLTCSYLSMNARYSFLLTGGRLLMYAYSSIPVFFLCQPVDVDIVGF